MDFVHVVELRKDGYMCKLWPHPCSSTCVTSSCTLVYTKLVWKLQGLSYTQVQLQMWWRTGLHN